MHRVYAWLRRHPSVLTGLVAVPLGVSSIPFALVADGLAGVLIWPVMIALVAGMVLRHRRPDAAYLLVLAAGLTLVAASDTVVFLPVYLAMPMVLYSVATDGPGWARWSGLFWIAVAPVLVVARLATGLEAPVRLTAGGMLVLWTVYAAPLAVGWIWGDATRSRRRWYQQLAERADRLERERRALDRAAVAEERARIARELHDVVAHHVSVIVVQADGARYALDTAPEQAREALGTISSTGREALTELRGLLGVLRSDSGDSGDSGGAGDGPAPQPGVAAIEALVDGAAIPATLSVTGRERPVTAGLGLTAYRVVQEALTNALKHGGPGTTAAVTLTWRRTALTVEVTDTGAGPAGTPGGHGITGMRERVASAGGRLETGPGPERGFRVRAELPFDKENE
ncbi:signal transduction histidine kinase [Catenuloplanes nepalensis]|uniref:histidine kinase n=1 Tax=Catenuloplanes nepalensis TaxID=587533 RepID=A0ABT9N104_9ACTN|nr:sensor histidine kinase [Catenuloplanes nepalensis]MDP9797369.1 signal transduction histidine kinase [Catenuloplanes nepalensis]